MPIVSQGTLNTTALVVPDLYVQIVPPQNLVLNGVPTNTVGVVGTASWGPVGQPSIVATMADYARTHGPLQGRRFDMGTQVATAVQQGASNFRCVRVTDGTDTAACVERFSSLQVRFVPGEPQNFKITYPSDVGMADHFLRTAEPGHDTDLMLAERHDDGTERDDPDGPPGRSAAVGAGRGVERNPPGLEPGDRDAER